MSTCVRTMEMKVRDGEWFTGWVRCMYILVWWAATEVGGLEGKLVVDGGCNPSATYLKELALNIGFLATSFIMVATGTHHSRCLSSAGGRDAAEMFPTDQLQLVLSDEEKQPPIWISLAVLQKPSTELLGICVSHRSIDCPCQQELAWSHSWIELRKIN